MKNFATFLVKPLFLFKKKAPLLSYIMGRLIVMAVTLFILGFAIFGLMALAPGDIVSQVMPQSREPGPNQPFYVQYLRWLNQVAVNRDLGLSLISQAPVDILAGTRLLNSLVLNVISLVLICFFSFLLGVYFSSRAGTSIGFAVTFFSLALYSFPGILLLILLRLLASLTGLFPATAYPPFPFSDDPARFVFSYAHHVFLPLLAAFLGGIGGAMRMIRLAMHDQLGQSYVTSLRSRGIAEWRIYLVHAFRNTLNPGVTGSANLLAGLFSGSLVLEIIFDYPGIGLLMYEAVTRRDINLVLVNLMLISFLVLLVTLLGDIFLALVDPRIRRWKEGA